MPKPSDHPAPIAATKAHTVSHHGHTLHDPYAWLRDPGYPAVTDEDILGYLHAENAYYQAALAPHEKLTESLYEEIVGRIQQDDSSVPHKHGNYLYHWEFESGAQYKRWLRTDLDGKSSCLLLDEVALAEGLDYFRLGGFSVRDDHEILAWSSDTDGSERYTIRLKEIVSGRLLPDEITGTGGSVVWSMDGQSFFYSVLSEEHRPYKIMLHQLGQPASADTCVYEEKDPSFFAGVSRTSSDRFIVISAGDHVTNELRIIPADEVTAPPQLISARRTGHEYYLDDNGVRFLIRTNDMHRNFRIVAASFDAPEATHWRGLIPPSDHHYLKHHTCFQDFFTVEERAFGQEQIRIRHYAKPEHEAIEHYIEFPEPSFSAALGTNAEFDSAVVRVGYQSMVTPPSVMDYHLEGHRLELRKEQAIPSGYDKSAYVSERLIASSHDGTKVPISIVYKKGFARDGSQPLHLYGYGAYGIGMVPSFSASRLSLLDRGFAYAIAHIRGGDEMGYHWYQEGKLDKRTNTFHDFIACAEHLIAEGYSSAGKISISGGSAGGTLMGAMANMRPDLWSAVVAHVPFVDVLHTMLDASLPLTPIEWPEWGNPLTDKEVFEYILSYSPYENTREQHYPNLMVTCGLNDPRVTYWEPAKWVAKLRTHIQGEGLIIFKTNMGAGHGGKSGRFEKFREVAEEYSFILEAVGKA